MPFPCATFSPDPTGLAVSTGSLQTGSPASSASADAASGASSTPFSAVLSGVASNDTPKTDADVSSDEKDSNDSTDTSSALPASAPMTAEQLAFLAALAIPSAPPPPTSVAPEPVNASETPALTLVGGEGRSVTDLLASGAETLEYRATTPLPAAQAPFVESPSAVSQAEPASTLPETQAASTTPLAPAQNQPTSTAASQPASAAPQTAPVVKNAAPSLPTATAVTVSNPVSVDPTVPVATTPVSPETPANDATTEVAGEVATATAAEAAGQIQLNPNAKSEAAPRALGRAKGIAVDRAEKSAGSAMRGMRSGEKSPSAERKNFNLATGAEEVKEEVEQVGTSAANWGKTMYHDARSFAAAVLAGDPATSASSASSTTTAATKLVEHASRAAELVHEIRNIADSLTAVDRNSVEVKFNFGDQDRLSVRVEYKDGTVQATFRTDSPMLRDAIAREWVGTTAASEARPYRLADPVFVSSPSGSGFSLGGDASRHQRAFDQQGQQQQPTPFDRFSIGAIGRSTASVAPAASSANPSRPETSGRLHVLA